MLDYHTIQRLVDGHGEAALKAAERARLAALTAGPAAQPDAPAGSRVTMRLRALARTSVRRLEAAVHVIAG